MELSNGLLVAILFVTVLSLGIGNLLAGLSEIADPRAGHDIDWIPLTWLILLLLMHLNLFWETLVILSLEKWTFAKFVYMALGPMMLFYVTNLQLPKGNLKQPGEARAHYFDVARPFFGLLAVLMLWVIGADLVLGRSFDTQPVVNLVVALLFLAMAIAGDLRFHRAATAAGAVIIPALLVLRSI